jgi:DNA excision repair protein ERCC-6
VQSRLARGVAANVRLRLTAEIEDVKKQMADLDVDVTQIQERMEDRNSGNRVEGKSNEPGVRRFVNESQHDFLVRTGKITPFSQTGRSLTRNTSNLQEAMEDVEQNSDPETGSELEQDSKTERMSHQHLRAPGFDHEEASEGNDGELDADRPRKRRRLPQPKTEKRHDGSSDGGGIDKDDGDQEYKSEAVDEALGDGEDDESEFESTDGDFATTPGESRSRTSARSTSAREQEDRTGLDDGNETLYRSRLKAWIKRRSAARRQATTYSTQAKANETPQDEQREQEDRETEEVTDAKEWHLPHPTVPDTVLDGNFRIPGDIYPSLFDYQKIGVQWLWELYTQQVGGIVGDEMGLGKTIQVISFLAGLHYSKLLSKPILIIAPATVMKQWVNEFHRWWPPLRVSILHTSGSGMLDVHGEDRDDRLEARDFRRGGLKMTKARKQAERVVDRVERLGHVLVTTYAGLQTYGDVLIPMEWDYVVLDEGHQIRNPNTAITIHCKELRTSNRIILSGTPMQNNLTELWSLFDFIFPMRLGTLVNFRTQFEQPIKAGGYASASNLQVQTAIRCAETLKDTISPYLLQRLKVDVAADLPAKVEQVLFCKLTTHQRDAYEKFLTSPDLHAIFNGRRQVLYGVDILRKICNHPDLADRELLSKKTGYNYGAPNKSGKMQVVKALLDVWKEGHHKTLLFCQTRIMLNIIEKFVRNMQGVNYRRMDGNTAIKDRQTMVDEFNNSPDIHVFLLTTKVGGLGVNLTGADRVLIYDPDWNPSTDVQARERAWRLGQKKEVTIYRLMTAGTIEEKIYHRQIFKQLLTNKVMKDPTQRQTFQMQDLHDLFALGSNDSKTETGELFEGTETKFQSVPVDEVRNDISTAHSQRPGPDARSREVHNIVGVAGIEKFQGGPSNGDDSTGTGPPSKPAGDSSRIMEGIFARSGVQSALEHDRVINGKKIVAADPRLIEKEAQRVAAAAANALKRAGEAARNVPVGTPTWTGEVGTAGRPTLNGRGGPSSASVIANLQNRNLGQSQTGSGNTSRASTPGLGNGVMGPRGRDFVKLIRDFLLVNNGQVVTQMLVNHFKPRVTTDQQQLEFTSSLRQIASLSKSGRMRGRWTLKDEYR